MKSADVALGVLLGIGVCAAALFIAAWAHDLGKESVLSRLSVSCREALR